MKRSGLWLPFALVFLAGVTCWGQGIIISEVAWAGTAASSADEWIELHNPGPVAIDLEGWSVCFADTVINLGAEEGATRVLRCSTLGPGEFLLLERTDDSAVADRTADVIYAGSLGNGGCAVRVVDPDGNTVDTANGSGGMWPAGTAADGVPAFGSMERIDPHMPDAPPNWRTASLKLSSGVDANDEPVCGTPGVENGATLEARHAPRIHMLRCERGSDHTITVEWTATDPDGLASSLFIDIDGSADDGATWTRLVGGLANGGSYVGSLAASLSAEETEGSLLIRVTATDPDGWDGLTVSGAELRG